MHIPYNPKLKELARKLRNNSTKAEVILWQKIKRDQLGVDFHRQKPILNYIVDFYSPDVQLAIEIDGYTHDYKVGDDKKRQKEIEALGVAFVRFSDKDVIKNTEGVVNEILKAIMHNTSPTPPQGGSSARSPLERGASKRRSVLPLTIFVFGNPDVKEDSVPVKLIPQLQKEFPEIEFVHLDPNEEWEVPFDKHFIAIDTVEGIKDIIVIENLDQLQNTSAVTMHDWDVAKNLKWLKKLGKIKKITIIGVPVQIQIDDLLFYIKALAN